MISGRAGPGSPRRVGAPQRTHCRFTGCRATGGFAAARSKWCGASRQTVCTGRPEVSIELGFQALARRRAVGSVRSRGPRCHFWSRSQSLYAVVARAVVWALDVLSWRVGAVVTSVVVATVSRGGPERVHREVQRGATRRGSLTRSAGSEPSRRWSFVERLEAGLLAKIVQRAAQRGATRGASFVRAAGNGPTCHGGSTEQLDASLLAKGVQPSDRGRVYSSEVVHSAAVCVVAVEAETGSIVPDSLGCRVCATEWIARLEFTNRCRAFRWSVVVRVADRWRRRRERRRSLDIVVAR